MSEPRITSGSAQRPWVSVITPTIPERSGMLAQLEATVAAQTLARPWEHIILTDVDREGCAKTVNRAVSFARADWLFLIADDDLLEPTCLHAHLEAAEGADIVYSPPIVEGEPAAPFHGDPPGIPSTALIRTSFWRTLGGYNDLLDKCEDNDFYTRALARKGVFRRLPESTWIYRLGHPLGNKSRQPWQG